MQDKQRKEEIKRKEEQQLAEQETIPILKVLIDLPKPKNVFAGILEGYSFKNIQRYILPAYNEYMEGKKKIDLRNEARRYFMEYNVNKAVLCVFLRGEITERKYMAGYCDFDIYRKGARNPGISL